MNEQPFTPEHPPRPELNPTNPEMTIGSTVKLKPMSPEEFEYLFTPLIKQAAAQQGFLGDDALQIANLYKNFQDAHFTVRTNVPAYDGEVDQLNIVPDEDTLNRVRDLPEVITLEKEIFPSYGMSTGNPLIIFYMNFLSSVFGPKVDASEFELVDEPKN